ncbi:cyclin-dependent kinase 2-associated protein 2 isoform X3 [Eptesicus fuscus]|nr:cyclin-dependent kinase 2-associated protein 2 isoform X3 [Eptesicus fuscus]
MGYVQAMKPPGAQGSQSTYTDLLSVIEEMGKEIRPTYAGSKSAMERLKRAPTTQHLTQDFSPLCPSPLLPQQGFRRPVTSLPCLLGHSLSFLSVSFAKHVLFCINKR